MTRRLISSGSPFEAEIGYSRAVVYGDWVFVSGTTGFDYAAMTIADDLVAQTGQCLRNIESALQQAGAGIADVVRVNYVLPPGNDFRDCWPVLRRWFGEVRPAAMVIAAGLMDPRMRIEIEVTARRQARPEVGLGWHRRIDRGAAAMGLPQSALSLTEYFAWEAEQPDRNEFYRGETFAMVGARRSHERIVINLARRLGNHLDGTPCEVFSEGMKVQIGNDAVLYPDIFVTCDGQDDPDGLVVTAPILVVEVLSPSTQGYDRSLKFALYRRLPSLREYVLIDPETRRVEVFRPDNDGHWKLYDMSGDEALVLDSVGAQISQAQVFSRPGDGRPAAA